MRAAFFATLLAFFTLFTCTAAQSPIITTSTSLTLSDDMQDDDLSSISIPENDDLITSFDDSAQSSVGIETSESGIQSDLPTDSGSQGSSTPADSSSTGEGSLTTADSMATVTTPSPVSTISPVSFAASSAAMTSAPITASPDETATTATTTPVPSATAVEEDESASVTPTPADAPTDSTITPSPSPSVALANSTDTEATLATDRATGLWSASWSTVSTAAVGVLGVIALRFGVFSGEL